MKFKKLLPRYDALNTSAADSDATAAQNTGANAIASYDPTAASNASSADVIGNYNTGESQAASAVSPIAQQVAANPTVTQLYQQGNALYNVPALQTQATNLQNQVTNEDPNGYQAARGFDIDNADVQNGIANQNAYILPQANAATANANTASNLASQYVTAGQAQNTQNLIAPETEASMSAANQSAEMSGLNQAQQADLTGLMQQMESGVTLSASQYQYADQLLSASEAYQAQQSINATTLANTIQGQKYITTPAGSTLTNTTAQQGINPGALAEGTGSYTY